MKIICATVLSLCFLSVNVQAEKAPICWRNAVTNEREIFDPYASAEKMREFVRPQTEEALSVYDSYIEQRFSPLESLKGVLNYHAQKQREKAQQNRRP